MKFVDANKGHRGTVLANGREVNFCTRARLGIRGWVETYVLDDNGKPRLNDNHTAFLRKRTRCNIVDFIPRRG